MSRSRLNKNTRSRSRLGKKSGAGAAWKKKSGAGAAKKFAGCPALLWESRAVGGWGGIIVKSLVSLLGRGAGVLCWQDFVSHVGSILTTEAFWSFKGFFKPNCLKFPENFLVFFVISLGGLAGRVYVFLSYLFFL